MYLAKVLKRLAQEEGIHAVLDAGCGGGDFSIGLHEAGYSVYGCDLSVSGIRHAASLDVGRFEIASLYENLTKPFALTHFDAIVSVEVIEHLYSPRTFVQRAHEALRPGGLLVVSTPYWGYLKNIALAVTNRTDKALTVLWEGGHIKHFSRSTLSKLMKSSGFEVIGFDGCGEGLRRYTPGLWNGMLMTFRKPATV